MDLSESVGVRMTVRLRVMETAAGKRAGLCAGAGAGAAIADAEGEMVKARGQHVAFLVLELFH